MLEFRFNNELLHPDGTGCAGPGGGLSQGWARGRVGHGAGPVVSRAVSQAARRVADRANEVGVDPRAAACFQWVDWRAVGVSRLII